MVAPAFFSPTPPSNAPSQRKELTLVELMQKSFMSTGEKGEASLHNRTIQLPFYQRLFSGKISEEELLLHFVNLSAIFDKIEEEIKTSRCFQEIVGTNLLRKEALEKDIAFFTRRFSLPRPAPSKEAKRFVEFIDLAVKENRHLLLAFLYVQYSGLFLGRMVYNATSKWLKSKINNWEEMAKENRGISYWHFEGLETENALKERKVVFIKSIDENPEGHFLASRLSEVAKQAFFHNFLTIQSLTEKKTA